MAIEFMFDIILRLGLVVATSFLFTIVFLAYLRLRNSRMLLISVGFGIFFVNALIHLPELFIEKYSIMLTENIYLLIYLIGLIFITFGVLKD